MPTLRKPQVRKLSAGAALAAALTPPPHAAAALLVYEPFDYPAVSTPLLDGTAATGLNLTGTYVSDAVHPLFQLRLSSPGLSYGNLASAPSATGAKLTQLNGSTSNAATVSLADPVRILPGQAIFFSALFTLDDSRNGNHRAQVHLVDGEDEIAFGEPVVGGRAIRAHAKTAATGGLAASSGDRSSFSNGQTLFLIGRYNNSPVALGDRLELLGYDTAASHPFPTAFDPADPNAILYQELRDIDIDLTRISAVRFEIRGADNNYIDELRIGSTVADVAPIPEPRTWLLMLCGLAAVAGAAGRSSSALRYGTGCARRGAFSR
jgi:hypothetical protein